VRRKRSLPSPASPWCCFPWLEIDNVPFSSYIPEDVRAQIPDPEVERGLWLYFLCAAAGGVLCAVSAITSHRRRYGVGPAPPTAP
jgi:hypothetical protein